MLVMKVLCVIIVCVCVKDSVQSGKDLYCKDPDIDKFYPVNSTWYSTTFCGNYTCKIRKKKTSNTLKVVNVTDTLLDGTDLYKSETGLDLSHAGSETHNTLAKKPTTGRTVSYKGVSTDVHDPEARRELLINIQDKIFSSLSDKEDRYLTDDEVSTITALLKAVKKSDLEALFEIYTLAKDIFKEIDAKSGSHQNSIDRERDKSKADLKTESTTPRLGAYFYDPIISQWIEKNGAEIRNVNPEPTLHSPMQRGIYYRKPYYRPEGLEPRRNQQITLRNRTYALRTPEVPSPYHWIVQRPESEAPLSLPFSYLNQNDVVNPYPDFTYNKPISVKSSDIPGDVNLPKWTPDQNQVSIHKAINDANSKLLHKVLAASNVDVIPLPQWRTKELSPEVIEDVRANVLQKSEKVYNMFPLRRRKIKLERVGKVIKLDDKLTRGKREIKDDLDKSGEDEYEVFIEKITCDSSSEPGFFRVGNQSLPYPACCPVKIQHEKSTIK